MTYNYLFDIDNTLCSAEHDAGFNAVSDALKKYLPRDYQLIVQKFKEIHKEIHNVFHRINEKSSFLNKLNSYDIAFSDKLVKHDINLKWSRDLWMYYLNDNFQLGLTKNQIMEVSQAFWDGQAINAKIYEDVPNFIKKLDNKYIITASDHRLRFEDKKIIYNPKFSSEMKLKRLKAQGLFNFFTREDIFLGDPYDKPKVEFWEKIMQAKNFEEKNHVIVFDDNENVIKKAMDYGFKGVLVDRRNIYPDSKVPDIYIKSFNELDLKKINT